ncbi:type VI secretion system-associated FHA domain protein TagH [Sphingomonas jatrophae]|uniref:FHA domain protein n=1 Tax=Sphingomonas jatrophae TaxID=1166337 RepID=A0A1I6M2A1_9SPHN|nr:type VI secretion system-associated FHA domain protein TagH [Sphingomonas jatrophae]SFS09793.1 FHA domain protein [Sphingomonas jatrophae]
MIRLRLFHRDNPSQQLDTRVLDEGQISIGRGTKADWQVSDPERDLSRLHLVVTVRGGILTVQDMSANGVFIGTPRSRIEKDRAIPVSRGESIVFGPYLLVGEEDAGAVPAPEPILETTPFGAPAGLQDDGPSRERKPDPFGSALRPDPIKLDEEPGDGVDAWDRPRPFQAGDWNPVAPHRQPDHSQLIGTPQSWPEPPTDAAREHGFGFDAPFTSPILREPEPPATGGALEIPSDWDAVPADGGAAADPLIPPPAAEAATSTILIPADALADLGISDAPTAPERTPEEPILPQAPAPQERPAPPQPAAVAATPQPQPEGADLFASFCAGARLSPEAFVGEDRELLMERLGAFYRQAVLGVADMMSDRTALKNDFRMVRTTIRPDGNNPFKWVPPQRLAIELLRSEAGSGYSTGDQALNEALHDIKAHILCVLAGMRAALGATFDLLAPSEIDKRIANRGFVMPGQRSAASWNEYTELFATLRREADDDAEGPINKAFRQAYEGLAAQLDGQGRAR